eukprot:4535776-Pleurochrysis_carterae.AAC.6
MVVDSKAVLFGQRCAHKMHTVLWKKPVRLHACPPGTAHNPPATHVTVRAPKPNAACLFPFKLYRIKNLALHAVRGKIKCVARLASYNPAAIISTLTLCQLQSSCTSLFA